MLDASVTHPVASHQFAVEHGLVFHGAFVPAIPAPMSLHRFDERTNVVTGQWRGRFIQRFVTPTHVVELMVLPAALPQIMIVPKTAAYANDALVGTPILTANAVLDGKWRLASPNPSFASAFLSAEMREALAHEAAFGKAIAVDGPLLYLWTPIEHAQSADARVRFEFLSVLAGRISGDAWQRFSTPATVAIDAASLATVAETVAASAPTPPSVAAPAAPVTSSFARPAQAAAPAAAPAQPQSDEMTFEPTLEAHPVDYVPVLEPDMGAPELPTFSFGEPEPEPQLPVAASAPETPLSATGELDVALLEARLGGAFIPEGDPLPETSGWIGGDYDTTSMYFTGPRVKGQARPH